VRATDGPVGRIDEFLVDTEKCHITHLVLREGNLLGKKSITIPVSEIDHIEEKVVHLKIDKKTVRMMPTIKVKRLW
jgi:sporulation protein YlmC with PRC-barrel domain